jgi:CBS domain-containing protein
MTEKIARRGVRVIGEYAADVLARVSAVTVATKSVVTLNADESLSQVRQWLGSPAGDASHQAFPLLDARSAVVGVLTRSELLEASIDPSQPIRSLVRRELVAVFDDESLREAADRMAREKVGRVPVIARRSGRLVGIVSRSDLLHAQDAYR